MKPFFSDKVFFYATEEELQTLRTCVANEMWKYDEETLRGSKYWDKLVNLFKDLTEIVEHLPF